MSPRSMAKALLSHAMPCGLPARMGAAVLTYHACFRRVPSTVANVDNIDPEILYDQLNTLKRWFKFLPIDDLLAAKDRRGLASVTFDDGYKSVIDGALPVLEALKIPATIFINPSSFEGKVFWRHKLIYLINAGLLRELTGTESDEFYRCCKTPGYDSYKLAQRIDRLLVSKGIRLENHLFDNTSYLINHPLISYGNHTYNHYVLSSLDRTRQKEEIKKTRDVLDSLAAVKKSHVFSLPFGEVHHMNCDTLSIIKELGYQSVLLNRGGMNLKSRSLHEGVSIVERFSPGPGSIEWQLKRECFVTLKAALSGGRDLAFSAGLQ